MFVRSRARPKARAVIKLFVKLTPREKIALFESEELLDALCRDLGPLEGQLVAQRLLQMADHLDKVSKQKLKRSNESHHDKKNTTKRRRRKEDATNDIPLADEVTNEAEDDAGEQKVGGETVEMEDGDGEGAEAANVEIEDGDGKAVVRGESEGVSIIPTPFTSEH